MAPERIGILGYDGMLLVEARFGGRGRSAAASCFLMGLTGTVET